VSERQENQLGSKHKQSASVLVGSGVGIFMVCYEPLLGSGMSAGLWPMKATDQHAFHQNVSIHRLQDISLSCFRAETELCI
jgi:hypothetical protein